MSGQEKTKREMVYKLLCEADQLRHSLGASDMMRGAARQMEHNINAEVRGRKLTAKEIENSRSCAGGLRAYANRFSAYSGSEILLACAAILQEAGNDNG